MRSTSASTCGDSASSGPLLSTTTSAAARRTSSGTCAAILPNERTSYTGTAGEVNPTNAKLATGDWLRIDCDDHGGGTALANGGQMGLFAIVQVELT